MSDRHSFFFEGGNFFGAECVGDIDQSPAEGSEAERKAR